MRKLSTSLLFIGALAMSNAQEAIDIDITASSGANIINSGNYTNYSIVNINLAENLVFTNTNQRLLSVKSDTTYNFTGGTRIEMKSSEWNGLVLGEASNTNSVLNFYTDVKNVSTSHNNIVLQGGTTLNIYKNFDFTSGVYGATGGVAYIKNGGTLTVNEYRGMNSNITIESGGTLNFNRFNTNGGTNAKNFTMYINGGNVTMSVGALTADNTLLDTSKIEVNSGLFNHTLDSSNYTTMNVQGTIDVNGGRMNLSATFHAGSVLTVNGGEYYTKKSQILNGGTITYKSGIINTATIALTKSSSIKLYNDLNYENSTGIKSVNFRTLADAGILDLYTNGFVFSIEEFYSSDGSDMSNRVNLIVEDGYTWVGGEGQIHITNMSVEAVKDVINEVKIGNQVYNKNDLLVFTSDGANGTYINMIPEPAEWAAFFGALALGLAVYRRRK